jgi:uncharacterized protein (DUF983 family)
MDEWRIFDGAPLDCPECGEEQWFVRVAGPEMCCSACETALWLLDGVEAAVRRASQVA